MRSQLLSFTLDSLNADQNNIVDSYLYMYRLIIFLTHSDSYQLRYTRLSKSFVKTQNLFEKPCLKNVCFFKVTAICISVKPYVTEIWYIIVIPISWIA